MIRLIITDDHPIYVDGLKSVLSGEPEISVIGEALNGKQLLKILENKNPDLILLDIVMPELNGMETLKIIKQKYPEIKILMLSQFGDKELFKKCMENDADGFLLKVCGKDELIKTIKKINAGETYFRSDRKSCNTVNKMNSSTLQSLSKREKEVLKLVCAELTNEEISNTLNITLTTVKTYRARIMQKVGVKNAIGLYKWSVANNIVDLKSF